MGFADYALGPMKLWPISLFLFDADDVDAILGPLILLLIIGSLAFYGFRRWRLRTAPKTVDNDRRYHPE